MLNIQQVRELIIIPSLRAIGLWSLPAEQLLLGTALMESNLSYLAQVPTPVAMSIFMVENPTYLDLRSYLFGNKALMQKILDFLSMDELPSNHAYLAGNLYAAAIFARIKYYQIKEPLPSAGDAAAMAKYWSAYYQTSNNMLQQQKFAILFNKYVMA